LEWRWRRTDRSPPAVVAVPYQGTVYFRVGKATDVAPAGPLTAVAAVASVPLETEAESPKA
jgi:hypothetical protein